VNARAIRTLSEAEVIRRWAELYAAGKHKGYAPPNPEPYLGRGATWVEIEVPHDLYDADWNAPESMPPRKQRSTNAHIATTKVWAMTTRTSLLSEAVASFVVSVLSFISQLISEVHARRQHDVTRRRRSLLPNWNARSPKLSIPNATVGRTRQKNRL